jgi:hypothetical protein
MKGDSKPEWGETTTSWSSQFLFDVYFTFILPSRRGFQQFRAETI